jgi:transposase
VHTVDGFPRDQWDLLPGRLEDYVETDNPVRFLDAFVEDLDVAALGFEHARPARTGRPPYAPQVLIKLYLYGYLNRVRSSRKLERETHRNVEVIWLLKRLHPDHKTIAEFRRRNRKALKGLFKLFIRMCKTMDLIGAELVAIDGTKVQANNSRKAHFSKAELEKRIGNLDRQIETYLQDLDLQDQQEEQPAAQERLTAEQVEALQQRRIRYQDYLKEMEQRGENQITLTDPDCRMMKAGQGTQLSYNVQTAVDAKHHLVVTVEVTSQATDQQQLAPMAQAAKEALGVETLDVVVDRGYENAQQIKACEDDGIRVHIPEPKSTVPHTPGIPEPAYQEDQFRYDAERDVHICPAGQVLTYRGIVIQRGRRMRRYRTIACKTCPVRDHCTRSKRGRLIQRWEDEETLEKVRARSRARPDILAKRKCLAEHPFGTVKHAWDQGYFLLRGRPKVAAETFLSFLAYNIKRVLAIFGVVEAIRKIKGIVRPLCASPAALFSLHHSSGTFRTPFPFPRIVFSATFTTF